MSSCLELTFDQTQMLGKYTHTHTHLLQTYMYNNIGTNCDQFYDENTMTGGAMILEFLVTILLKVKMVKLILIKMFLVIQYI